MISDCVMKTGCRSTTCAFIEVFKLTANIRLMNFNILNSAVNMNSTDFMVLHSIRQVFAQKQTPQKSLNQSETADCWCF